MIFVAGAPRSGTSMTCGVMAALGVNFGGKLAQGDRNNRRGYYENVPMRQLLKSMSKELGVDPLGQWPLPPRDWRPSPGQALAFRSRAEALLRGAEAHKDAKTLPLWPLVRAAFPEARWVVVRRDPVAVARSCRRATFMSRFQTQEDWERWARDEMAPRCQDLIDATGAVEVWPDARDPESFGALTALGLDWDAEAVAATLAPEMWHP